MESLETGVVRADLVPSPPDAKVLALRRKLADQVRQVKGVSATGCSSRNRATQLPKVPSLIPGPALSGKGDASHNLAECTSALSS